MKLTFWGAAGEVTGSMHLVEAGGKRYLLDCGLHQGRRKEADRKNRHLPFPASSIDAVVLSHAHIDHSGNLPTLVEARLFRPDLRHAGHDRSLQLDAARHGAHPGERRRVPQQAARAAQVDGPGKRPRRAALHHGGCRAHAAAVPARFPTITRRTWRPDLSYVLLRRGPHSGLVGVV